MDLKEREILYIEHMKPVLEKWMDDKRNYHRELSDKERYPSLKCVTLSERQIDSWFDESLKKLKEFYGIDDILTEHEVKNEISETKLPWECEKVYIRDLKLPLKIDELLYGANINTIDELLKLRQDDVLNIHGLGKGKINRLIENLNYNKIQHNFKKMEIKNYLTYDFDCV